MIKKAAGLLTSAVLLASMPALAKDYAFTGTATGLDGKVLYEEQHTIDGTCQDGVFRPQQQRVEYHKPGASSKFAWKELDYSASVIRPSVHFIQPDFDEVLKIRYPNPGTLIVNWDTPSGGAKRFEVEYPDGTVVDAGFVSLALQNWESVLAGDSVEFRLLAPARGKHYGFVLEKTTNGEVHADHVMQIRPTGMVLGFLVDPIVLGFNDNGALTDYYGLTNIRKNQNTNYTAHIRYPANSYLDCELIP